MNIHRFSKLAVPRSPTSIIAARSLAALLCLLTTVGLCLSGCHDLEGTKRNGNQILQALEQYHVDHDQYPKSLAELSPKYLRELPPATWGLRTWEYESDGEAFTLGVDETARTGDGDSHWLRYQGEKWGWQVGD